MKKLLPLTLTILMLPTLLLASGIRHKEVKLSAFNRIAIIGSYKIAVTQSNDAHLDATGQTSIIEKIKVSVRDGLLMIEMPKQRDRRMRLKSNEIPVLHLSFKSINNIYIDGYADISSSTPLKFASLTVTLKGSSKVNLASIACDYLHLETNGASYIKLHGKTKNFKLHMKGSGMFDGYNLLTSKADVTIDGTGKARVNVIENLTAKISIFGTLFYKGHPAINVIGKCGIIKQQPEPHQ